ncbi:YoaK family protein [Nonomuraea sp. N2-4H]|uniref:DUF1275 family protein n=1 Tax=Nonomuraea sp. N2-4H TaxID=3128898 RepID=UPI00324E79F5
MRSVPRLPVLSLALASGAVDAFTFLSLGHVFTSNMTGNLVLLGISAAWSQFADAVGSLVALAAFTCGLAAAFRFTRGVTGWAPRTRLAVAAEAELVAVLFALALGATGGTLLVRLLPLAAPALALFAVTVALAASAYA